MLYDEKIKLLKAMRLLSQIPERQLAGLSEFLRLKELEPGAVIFQEGSTGMSLYFVSSGRVRISKSGSDGSSTDLAMLGPGDFFGEMALIAEAPRSASAIALGPCVLFELFHGDLARWVKSNPQQAVQFFAELVHLLSDRLRRTSNELTLHSDLSNLLFEQTMPVPVLLPKVLDRVLPRLDGVWSAAVYLCGDGGATELIAVKGDFKFEGVVPKGSGGWLDASTFHVMLGGLTKTVGHLVFHAQAPVPKHDHDDISRTLTTVARLTSSALELHRPSKA
jgi:CRP-like cAMP-binding protein